MQPFTQENNAAGVDIPAMHQLLKELHQVGEQTGYTDEVIALLAQSAAITGKALRVKLAGGIDTDFIKTLPGTPLQQDQIDLSVIPYPGIDTTNEEAVLQFLSDTDLLIYLTNASGVLTKADVALLQQCKEKEIRCVVALVGLHQVDAGERAEVIEYAQTYLKEHFPNIPFIEPDKDGFTTPGLLWQYITSMYTPGWPEQQRLRFFQKKITHQLLVIRNFVLGKKEDAGKKIGEIKEQENKTALQISGDSNAWTVLSLQLRDRRLRIEEQLRTLLVKKKQQLIDTLFFELERSQDIKTSWQTVFPHLLTRELASYTENANAAVLREVTNTEVWLANEAARLFQHKINFVNSSQQEEITRGNIRMPAIELASMRKVRNNSRLGNVATLLGVGALFVSLPVGGFTLIASLTYQHLAERYFTYRTNTDRDKVKPVIDQLVGQLELQLLHDFSNKIEARFDELLLSIRNSQTAWLNEKMQQNRETSANEILLVDPVSWDTALKHINSLLIQLL